MNQLVAVVMGSFDVLGGSAAWDARPIDLARFDDWIDDPMFTGDAIAPTVRGVFEQAASALAEVGGLSFLERTTRGDRVRVAGMLVDDEIPVFARSILGALREAADVGASGAVALVVPAMQAAVRITLEGAANGEAATSSLEIVQTDELFANESLAEIFVDASGWMVHKEAHPSATRAEYVDGESRYWLEKTPSPAEARALEAACTLGDDELAAALDDPRLIGPDMKPLGATIADAGALRAELDARTPLARIVAAELFAHARGDEAEPTVIELASAPSKYLARLAYRALGLLEGERVIAALRQGLDHPTEWSHAAGALATSPDPRVDEALTAWLSRDEVELDPRTDEAVRAARFARAERVLAAVAERRNPAHATALFALFDDPQMRLLVPNVVQALASLGTPEVEARGEELQMAFMGMGKALNQDHARRAELLAIDDEDSGGIVSYGGLDVGRLTQLLDEGFIHPATRQNEAPSTLEIFQVMQQFPEIRASGYAVVPSRPDYRVSIDGLSVDLSGMDEDRAGELRQLFQMFEQTANNSELEGEHLSVWWT